MKWIVYRWFTKEWYFYLFRKADNPYFCSKFKRLICRIKHHPEGPIYYNIGGDEPDYTCKICGDEL